MSRLWWHSPAAAANLSCDHPSWRMLSADLRAGTQLQLEILAVLSEGE